jgi:DNA-binding XRE family transcriptional regulator
MKSEQIIQLRAGLGLSRAEFARVFGVTEKTTFNWETGRVIPRGRAFELLQCFVNVKKGSQLWGRMIEMIHAGQTDALAQFVVSAIIGSGIVPDSNSVAASTEEANFVLTAVSQSAFIGIEISRPQLQSIFTHLHEKSDGLHRSELQELIKSWMDWAPEYEMSGGFGHRILHGHSLSDGFLVFRERGIKGLRDWTMEESFDVMSPDGLPLPWGEELWKASGVNVHQAVRWLCFNATDVVIAGAAAIGLIKSNDNLPSRVALNSMAQLALGFMSGNPLLLATGSTALTGSLVAFLQGREITEVDLSMRGFRAFSTEMESWRAFTPDFDTNNF